MIVAAGPSGPLQAKGRPRIQLVDDFCRLRLETDAGQTVTTWRAEGTACRELIAEPGRWR